MARKPKYLLKAFKMFSNCFARILESEMVVSNQKFCYLWIPRALKVKVIQIFIPGAINLPLTQNVFT